MMLPCAAADCGVGGVGVGRFFSSMHQQIVPSAIKMLPQRCFVFMRMSH